MESTLEIAIGLDHFAYEFDPYEYHDTVEDSWQNILKTIQMLQNNDARGILNWLTQAMDETTEGTYEYETALRLFQIIERKVNS